MPDKNARQNPAQSKKRRPKYWIFTEYEECVVCGREHVYRIRRYTPKPKEASYRYHYRQFACGEHFC